METEKLSKGQRTARHILDSAAHCIATVGIERTSITEIARRAEVSRALVAHHFPRKADLFAQIIDHITQEGWREIEAPADDLPPARKLLHMVEHNLRFFLGHPHFYKCFMLFYYFAALRPDFLELNTRLRDRARERIRAYLAELARERKAKLPRARLEEWVESIHLELVASVQGFFIWDRPAGEDEESYLRRTLARFERRLEGFGEH